MVSLARKRGGGHRRLRCLCYTGEALHRQRQAWRRCCQSLLPLLKWRSCKLDNGMNSFFQMDELFNLYKKIIFASIIRHYRNLEEITSRIITQKRKIERRCVCTKALSDILSIHKAYIFSFHFSMLYQQPEAPRTIELSCRRNASYRKPGPEQ